MENGGDRQRPNSGNDLDLKLYLGDYGAIGSIRNVIRSRSSNPVLQMWHDAPRLQQISTTTRCTVLSSLVTSLLPRMMNGISTDELIYNSKLNVS